MPSLHLTTLLTLLACTILPAVATPHLFPRDTIKTCPAMNNQYWNSPSGASTWKLGCDRDTGNDGTLHAVEQVNGGTGSFEDCIKICGNSNHVGWCKSASFSGPVNGHGDCYLKGGNTGPTQARTGWKLAIRQ